MSSHVDENDIAYLFPHLAPCEADDATVALLAAQSKQLVQDLTPALSRLIQLVPGAGAATSLLDALPQLLLIFYPMNPRRRWTPDELPGILRAFAVLASHSQRLNTFPALKTQFWIDVLQSEMAHEHTSTVQKNEFMHASFPNFVIDFGGFTHALLADLALEDALVAFMTTPPSLTTPASATTLLLYPRASTASPPPRLLAFGFVFRAHDVHIAWLGTLERFLDRTFASPTRQYGLRMLGVKQDKLVSLDRDVLARIVRKSVHKYGVEELRLDVPVGFMDPRGDWVCPETTLDIMRTVYAMDALPALASRQVSPPAAPVGPTRLRRLSMSKIHYRADLFATRFSALRYGCALDEDTTTYVSDVDGWRWFAFGLFYPRPKRFARRFHLHNIGHIQHCPPLGKTIAKTLRNPAAELIYGARHERNNIPPPTELMVCVVEAGAAVDLFQTSKIVAPIMRTDSFATACELEAIYERADGAVCVVVPGVGLGWVRAESVVRIEREPLERARSEQCGLFSADLGWGTQARVGGNGWWEPDELEASMQTMVETLGTQFNALSFGRNHVEPGFLSVVFERCTNLTKLNLESQKVTADDGAALLDALSGALGDRLHVLNVNDFRVAASFFDKLLMMMRKRGKLSALRELRLGGHYLNAKRLESLRLVLKGNSQLTLVEAHIEQSWTRMSSEEWKALVSKRDYLNAVFHGQLLRASVPIRAKLAFLSVIQQHQTAKSAVKALDAWLIRSIFGFAGDRDVRRTLVWNERIRCGGQW